MWGSFVLGVVGARVEVDVLVDGVVVGEAGEGACAGCYCAGGWEGVKGCEILGVLGLQMGDVGNGVTGE